MLMFLLVFWMVLITWVLFYSFREIDNPMRMNFKAYYQRKVAKINNNFGRGTWKKFIKNDLGETQQIIKKTLSKKAITSDEYHKLTELVDEMETYINNNTQQGSNIELDEEIILLHKINREKVKTRLKEMGRIK